MSQTSGSSRMRACQSAHEVGFGSTGRGGGIIRFSPPQMPPALFAGADQVQNTLGLQVLDDLRRETEAAIPIGARMLVSPEQGQFMAFLVQSLGVRRAIEVGVFTGYSSTVIAMVSRQRRQCHCKTFGV